MKLRTLEATMRQGMKTQRGLMNSWLPLLIVVGGSMLRYVGRPGPWWKLALAVLVGFGVATYGWRTRTEGKRLFDLYEDRLRELLDATYHAITFADAHEAAAFVAALGRQLHSPREDLASYDEDVEISAATDASGTTLYLSDGAMRAFTIAFAAPPETRAVVGRDLPPVRIAVLVGAPSDAIGRDDVLKLLSK